MATVKIALAVLLLALLTSNGFGLPRMLMTAPECHKVDDCNKILRDCKGERVCDKGVCMCLKNKEAKKECREHADCEVILCPPPSQIPHCDTSDDALCSPPSLTPYCDFTNSLCTC
ncbi:hypothetical protein PHAVU_007G046200 [Phaseolus vulgaris]|uniref:Uncharacterized protein n=1 Tax=Phaseolus vulgaris TaxID=3885 RepID=V7BB52_PHAVU|nr:hypothetical protein PHAVU_007G046200g [Phaseolus vulgaris]ESW15122.1 hypothetical protein PHAVU_007G046200g [Phaseolus vulgaris]